MRWALFVLRNATERSNLSNSAQVCISPSTEELQLTNVLRAEVTGCDFNFLLHCFPPISPSHWAGSERVTLGGHGNRFFGERNYFLCSPLHASPNHKHTWFPIISPNQTCISLIFYALIPSPKPAGLCCWGTCGITYKWEGSNAKRLKCRLRTHILKCWTQPWESGLKGKASLV